MRKIYQSSHRKITRQWKSTLSDLINREGTVVYSVRAVGRSVVRLPGPWFLHGCDRRVAYIKQETQVWITLSLFNHCGCDDHNSGRGIESLAMF